jgi:hypothetical protein
MPLTENCKDDVSIAKNYLKGVELEDMGRLVNAVLDMAERMAKRHTHDDGRLGKTYRHHS